MKLDMDCNRPDADEPFMLPTSAGLSIWLTPSDSPEFPG